METDAHAADPEAPAEAVADAYMLGESGDADAAEDAVDAGEAGDANMESAPDLYPDPEAAAEPAAEADQAASEPAEAEAADVAVEPEVLDVLGLLAEPQADDVAAEPEDPEALEAAAVALEAEAGDAAAEAAAATEAEATGEDKAPGAAELEENAAELEEPAAEIAGELPEKGDAVLEVDASSLPNADSEAKPLTASTKTPQPVAKPKVSAPPPEPDLAMPPVDGADVPAVDDTGALNATASEVAGETLDDDDVDLDVVPILSYDDKKSNFSKKDRLILSNNGHFPSIFCALRVVVRLEADDICGCVKVPTALSKDDVEELLREDFKFGKSMVFWEDSGFPKPNGAREVIAALNAGLPDDGSIGSIVKPQRWGITATITEVTETSDDNDPDRITALARCITSGEEHDALRLELPQLWIIPDPDFKAKRDGIGLYPGSYWMGFFKTWGALHTAEIFFKTVKRETEERIVHLVVQFRNKDHLRTCFAFLHGRYLAHPKKDQGLRQAWCELVNFNDLREAAGSKPKDGTATGGKAPAKATAPRKIIKSMRLDGSLEITNAAPKPVPPKSAQAKVEMRTATKTPVQARPTPEPPKTVVPKVSAKKPAAKLAPMTPLPKAADASKTAAAAVRRKTGEKAVASTAPTPPAPVKAPTPTPPAPSGPDGAMTPADLMSGLGGRQLEAFQMVMSRMERLEKENQELMQILLQMQSLLQQQQQRNAKLQKEAGMVAFSDRLAFAGQSPPALGGAAFGGIPGLMPQHLGAMARPSMAAPLQQPSMSVPSSMGAAAAPPKRKAPSQAVVDLDTSQGDAEAPWKRQRRRQKRPKESEMGMAGHGGLAADAGDEAADEDPGGGLAAYHKALLGV